MRGLKHFVLHAKGLQNQLISRPKSSPARFHTSPSPNRFWNFFELTAKGDVCRDARSPSAGNPASSSVPGDMFDNGAVKNFPSNATHSATPFTRSRYGCAFDLKSTPMSCTRPANPVQQEDLMSFLDGNPVPKTLKWKLKGYKTLRNARDIDFAFVPGEKSYDRDIISRKIDVGARSTRSASEGGSDRKAISRAKSRGSKVAADEKLKTERVAVESATEKCKSLIVGPARQVSAVPAVLASPVPKKEEKSLLVSKPEVASGQSKCAAQPVAQHSLHSPKRIQNAAPTMKRSSEERSAMDRGKSSDKSAGSQESIDAKHSKRDPSRPEKWNRNRAGIPEVETESSHPGHRGHARCVEGKSARKGRSALQQESQSNSPEAERVRQSGAPHGSSREKQLDAEESNARSGVANANGSPQEVDNTRAYDFFSCRPCSTLNIFDPALNRVKSPKDRAFGEDYQKSSFRGRKSAPNSRNSERGPEKSLKPFSPLTKRHVSSNTCCSTRKTVPGESSDGSFGNVKSRNTMWSVSACIVDRSRPADEDPCCGEDDDRSRGRCEQERSRCKEPKTSQKCGNHCWPQLKVRREDDYAKSPCSSPNGGKSVEEMVGSVCLADERWRREIFSKIGKLSFTREKECIDDSRRIQSYSHDGNGQKRRFQRERNDRVIFRNPRDRGERDDDRQSRSAKCPGGEDYVKSACIRRSKPFTRVKRCSSMPAVVRPAVNGETIVDAKQQSFLEPMTGSRYYGRDSREPSSKGRGCRRSARKDPCETVKERYDEKEDCCRKSNETCGSTKSRTASCGKSKPKCDDQRQLKMSREQRAQRMKKEKKEVRDCKNMGKKCKRENPCEPKQSGCDSRCKFSSYEEKNSTNTLSNRGAKKDVFKGLNIAPGRCYSTTSYFSFDSNMESDVDRIYFNVENDHFDVEMDPVPAMHHDSHVSAEYTWFDPW